MITNHEARHKNKSKGRHTIPQEATLELSLPPSPVSLSNDFNDKDRIVVHPQSARSSLLVGIELLSRKAVLVEVSPRKAPVLMNENNDNKMMEIRMFSFVSWICSPSPCE